MPDKFPAALAHLLSEEGGVSIARSDSASSVVAVGQPHTNLGIALKTVRALDADGRLPQWLKDAFDVNDDGNIDSADVPGWTPATAASFYRTYYWEAAGCDRMPWPFAAMVFDLAVNAGVTQALRTMQRALDIRVDGVLGPQTLRAVGRVRDVDAAAKAFTVQKLDFYRQNVTAAANFRGWASRSIDTLLFCLMESTT